MALAEELWLKIMLLTSDLNLTCTKVVVQANSPQLMTTAWPATSMSS
jgi:hypothetical protein